MNAVHSVFICKVLYFDYAYVVLLRSWIVLSGSLLLEFYGVHECLVVTILCISAFGVQVCGLNSENKAHICALGGLSPVSSSFPVCCLLFSRAHVVQRGVGTVP